MTNLLKIILIILGTKIDLREDKEALQALAENGASPIKREQGQKLSNKIRAVKYLECSALTQRGLKQVRDSFHLDRKYSIAIDNIRSRIFAAYLTSL